MCTTISWRVAVLITAVFALSRPVLAQTEQTKLTGLIHDYTASLDASGKWQVVGAW